MTKPSFWVRTSLWAMVLLAAAPLAIHAGKTTPLKANVYNWVVDEQNTTAYYNNGSPFCSSTQTEAPYFVGDYPARPGDTTSWNFTGSPWSPVSGTSSLYVHNDDCGPNCLRVLFDANNKVLSLDTRGSRLNGTGPTRTLTFNFTQPCSMGSCGVPGGSSTVFGTGTRTDAMLLNVFLNFSYTTMGICSSAACQEAEPAFAKVWFSDPADASTTWRVDWAFLRVLRMSLDTCYVIADSCDGTQIAGLSKLVGNRTRPKTVFNGYYKIPFFFSVKLK